MESGGRPAGQPIGRREVLLGGAAATGSSVPPTAKETFLARFADARAVARFSSCETGFSFHGRASSAAGEFAELGAERNGSFL